MCTYLMCQQSPKRVLFLLAHRLNRQFSSATIAHLIWLPYFNVYNSYKFVCKIAAEHTHIHTQLLLAASNRCLRTAYGDADAQLWRWQAETSLNRFLNAHFRVVTIVAFVIVVVDYKHCRLDFKTAAICCWTAVSTATHLNAIKLVIF